MPGRAAVARGEALARLVPSCEVVRFTCSGTEAVMSAVRLARAATGRDRILKFAGGYHGHADGFLVEAGSGAAPGGVPSRPGVPKGLAAGTLTPRYNHPAGAGRVMKAPGGEGACGGGAAGAGNTGVRLEALGAELEEGLLGAAARWKERLCVQRVGSLLTVFFAPGPIRDFEGALRCDREGYGRFFRGMLRRGVHLPPAQFEAWFLSAAHGDEEIALAVSAARDALAQAFA